jgi:protein-tyrosine-phosphatase
MHVEPFRNTRARVHPVLGDRARLAIVDTVNVADVIQDGDLIIAVCDKAHEDLTGPIRPRLHWPVPDPVPIDTDEAFESAYTDLADRIRRIAPGVTN